MEDSLEIKPRTFGIINKFYNGAIFSPWEYLISNWIIYFFNAVVEDHYQKRKRKKKQVHKLEKKELSLFDIQFQRVYSPPC